MQKSSRPLLSKCIELIDEGLLLSTKFEQTLCDEDYKKGDASSSDSSLAGGAMCCEEGQ